MAQIARTVTHAVVTEPDEEVKMARLAQLLAGLGTTAEKVAESLAFHGIEGRQRDAGNCPIAVYLRYRTGMRIGVWGLKLVYQPSRLEYINENWLDLTPAVREFVQRFDNGEFRNLRGAWR